MKKYVAILLLIVVILLVSCSDNRDVEVQRLKDEIEELKSTIHGTNNVENELPTDDKKVISQPDITTEPIVEEIITENPDVRNAKWGMSKDEVIATESKEIIASGFDRIMLYDTIVGFSTAGMYHLDDDRLYGFQYTFTQKHTNLTDFIADYNKIKNTLSELYNEPEEDEIVWKDALFADRPSDYGTAVSVGHLAYYSIWQTETTIIRLLLSGDNYNIRLALTYTDINYEEKTDTSGL